MKTLKALWSDESGAIVSTEIVLVITILGIGMIVGLTTLRNDVVTELVDTAQAVSNIDQSYSYNGIVGHASETAGSGYDDTFDFCEGPFGIAQAEQCVSVSNAPGDTSGNAQN